MSTLEQVSEKFLAYDGDCPMCTSTVALLVRLDLVAPQRLRSNHALEGDDLETVRAAGIRNQLVVLDPVSRETRSGTDGLLWIIGDHRGHPFWVRVLAWPGIRRLLRWGYETISYNRRVISPPRHQIVCDCEPEVTVARRLMLVVPALVLAFAITAWAGAAVFRAGELGAAAWGALYAAAAAGVGWAAIVTAAVVILDGTQRIDYIAHCAVAMLAGSLVVLPACLIVPWVPPSAAVAIAWLAALASFALMFAMQRRRVAAIGLSAGWLWYWAGTLALGCGAVGYFYFGSQPA